MVPNQRQLFIVISDWGSYLGSHFLICVCGILSTFSCLSAQQKLHFSFGWLVCCFVLFSEFRFIKIMLNSTHAAPWSNHYNERDNTVQVKSLGTPTHSRGFLYLYYFLHCRIIVKTS